MRQTPPKMNALENSEGWKIDPAWLPTKPKRRLGCVDGEDVLNGAIDRPVPPLCFEGRTLNHSQNASVPPHLNRDPFEMENFSGIG